MLHPKVFSAGLAAALVQLLPLEVALERTLLVGILYKLITSYFFEIEISRAHLVWLTAVAHMMPPTPTGAVMLMVIVAAWTRLVPQLRLNLNI